LVMDRLGIKFDCWLISGHFHMEVCVNDTLSKFLREEDATDIVLIDSDESWNPAHLIRLLMHEEDIVCGVYRKCEPKKIEYPVVIKTADDGTPMGKMLPDGNCLLECEKLPGGFLKISKRALQLWVEKNPDKWFWTEDRKTYRFFENEIRDNIFNGMDYVFAEKMRSCGITLWVDPICDIIHWGINDFNGTYDNYLRTLKKNQEADGAFSVIREMAKEIEARNG